MSDETLSLQDETITDKTTAILAKVFFAFTVVYLLLILSQFYWAGVGLLSDTPDTSNHTATGNIIATLPVGFILVGLYVTGYKIANLQSSLFTGCTVVAVIAIFWAELANFVYALYTYKHIFEGGAQLSSLDPPGEVAIGTMGYVFMLILPIAIIGFLLYKFKGSFPVPADWRLAAFTMIPFILSHVQYMLIWPFQESFIGDAEGMGGSSALHPLNGVIIMILSIELVRRTMPLALGEKYRFGFSDSDGSSRNITKYIYYLPIAVLILMSFGGMVENIITSIEGL